MPTSEKQKEYMKKYRAKKPHINSYISKKHYWRTWFEEDYIKELYDKHGEEAFEMLKKIKKEQKNKIKEEKKEEQKKEQKKEINRLLMRSLKSISVN